MRALVMDELQKSGFSNSEANFIVTFVFGLKNQ
jgi:hypothetical protein